MKKKEKDIRVEMVRVEGDFAPLVKVNYMDKNAEERSALMVLDSCSTINVLSSEIANNIGTLCKKNNDNDNIITSTNTIVSLNCAVFSFAIDGEQFREPFHVNDCHLPNIKGDIPIIGILGNKFLMMHHLVIDYSDFSIHTSNANSGNLSISDCDYFVPMGYGLVYYGIPLLAMIQGGKQIFTMADTGASFNIIAKQTISDNGFKCHYLKETDSIYGIGGAETEAEDAIVNFKLETLIGEDGSVDEVSHCSQFKVIPHYIYTLPQGSCDKNGALLPPIEAIICSPFMAKEGWALDFGAKIIYKRKAE